MALPNGKILKDDKEITAVLSEAQTIAVLGLSPKPARDSHQVAKYLQKNGFRIIPVRPAQAAILGEKAYKSLNDIGDSVDIVDVFRHPNQVMQHAQEALHLKPTTFWMQKGIEHYDAALMLTAAGINVVMNRCIKVEYERLIKTANL
ncbi:MAG: CoA-binding protein [Desulfobacterales bacterium]